MKQLKVSPLVYEMLQELSKKKRMKPDLFAEMLTESNTLVSVASLASVIR